MRNTIFLDQARDIVLARGRGDARSLAEKLREAATVRARRLGKLYGGTASASVRSRRAATIYAENAAGHAQGSDLMCRRCGIDWPRTEKGHLVGRCPTGCGLRVRFMVSKALAGRFSC